jgi:branched-chain amino acid transport system substrate-binding protein
VFDSNSSGIAVACAPIAKELKTIYFPDVTAAEIAGEKGNRYVFQFTTNVKSETKGAAEFAIKNFGKKWAVAVVNYAWGWSQEKEFSHYIEEAGGTVLKSVKVPLGTGDWLPYLAQIPSEAEAIYFANFGSDFLSFLRDLHAVRPNIKKLGAYYVLAGQNISALGAPGEDLYCITSYPMCLSGLDTAANRAFRKAIGVDDYGKEIGGDKYFVLGSDWCLWEAFFAMKKGMEKCGWAGKQDNPKLIKTLEGMSFSEDFEFPQGDVYIRAADHLAITGLYVEHVKNGDLEVVEKILKEKTEYSPLVDFTKEKF